MAAVQRLFQHSPSLSARSARKRKKALKTLVKLEAEQSPKFVELDMTKILCEHVGGIIISVRATLPGA